jgi:hypothetical protein
MMLRDRVRELMVGVHGISPELAAAHVREMSPSEVKRRFLMYVRPRISGTGLETVSTGSPFSCISSGDPVHTVSGPVLRVAKGAIGNLTINGMGSRAGKHSAHAGSREFPRREPEREARI